MMDVRPQNHWRTAAGVTLLVSCMGLIACTLPFLASQRGDQPAYHFGPTFNPKVANVAGTLELLFTPTSGRKDQVRTFSRTVTRTFSEGQLLHEREETVDFLTQSTVTSVDEKAGNRHIVIETVRKDGPVDLYDLGYPELGESIDYVFSSKAEVKKAGNFPPNSLFFVPPISLPKRPVEVGETWSFTAQWISLRNGLPMGVDMVSIFKRVFACGVNQRCAEIELAGEVIIPEGAIKGATTKSLIKGRILYNMDAGAVIWSDVRNSERMVSQEGVIESFSCTEAILEEPKTDIWPWRARPQCDPMKDLSLWVPGYEEK